MFCRFLSDIRTPFTFEVWYSQISDSASTMRLHYPAVRQMYTCVFASAAKTYSFGQISSYRVASSPVSWLISVVPNTASSHVHCGGCLKLMRTVRTHDNAHSSSVWTALGVAVFGRPCLGYIARQRLSGWPTRDVRGGLQPPSPPPLLWIRTCEGPGFPSIE